MSVRPVRPPVRSLAQRSDRRRSRSSALVVLAAVAALALTGCSDDGSGSGETVTEPIKVTITQDDISPKGERVKVKAGEPFEVEITADRTGSLHVHSNPEQELEFENGTVTREMTIDRPGVVEVESHDPDLVILQLEVQ